MNKTLVAFFSAQGHTEAIARTIAQKLAADIYEIQPLQPYSEADLDWTNPEARCSLEYNDETLQNIELANLPVDNWDEYDRVVLLYPIWWSVAAWAAKSFANSVNWGDKIVYPVAVSHSSPLGDSATLLQAGVDGGKWQAGNRFSQSVSEQEIANWCDSL